ncbi:MAG: 50S ribosomal protein L6 [Phycisphaerales bacterium]|nr:50S ribosomal protein L6 [Phycisphaerales bacterium]
MSRLGKKPVAIPANVKVETSGRTVKVSSGANQLAFTHRPEVKVTVDDKAKQVVCSLDEAVAGDGNGKAYWGLTRAMIQNMVNGVTKGYEKTLEVVGVGFTAEVAGKDLKLKLGFANPIMVPIPAGVKVSVDKQFVKIQGADKHAVGQFAAAVRAKRKPEPYNGKGVKYTDEVIRRKEGKAFGA